MLMPKSLVRHLHMSAQIFYSIPIGFPTEMAYYYGFPVPAEHTLGNIRGRDMENI